MKKISAMAQGGMARWTLLSSLSRSVGQTEGGRRKREREEKWRKEERGRGRNGRREERKR